MKCDERFISYDFDVNPISSKPCDIGNVSIIGTCTYTEDGGFTKDFDNFCGCQTDINIIHLTTGTYECHLHFCDDNSSEFQLYEVWGVIKFSVIRKYDIAKKSTCLIHGTVVQQCHFFVSDPVELWVC